MTHKALFTLGLFTPLLLATGLPLDARATSCAFPFTGETAPLTPTAVRVGEPEQEEEAEIQPYAEVTWTVETDIDGYVVVTVKNDETSDYLYLRAE